MKNLENDELADDLTSFMLEYNEDGLIKLTLEEEERIKEKVKNYLCQMTPHQDSCT